MRSYRNAVFGLFAASASFASAAAVTDLDPSNFDAFMNSHDVVMAEFYAPWCGICQELEPLYEETASKLDPSKDMKFARVDCVAHKDLCEDYKIRIFPTIHVFKGMEDREIYNGKREMADMTSFVERRYQPAVTALTTDTIEGFKTADKVAVVGYWAADDKQSNQTYTNVARSLLDDYTFGATTDQTLAEADTVSQPSVVLYKQYDEGKVVYDGQFELEAIKEFINSASHPLIGELTVKTSWRYIHQKHIPFACIFAETASERESLAQELKPVAEKTKGKLNWAVADPASISKILSRFNLEGDKLPAVGILDAKANKYPFNQDSKITEEAVSQFTDDFIDGKIPPHVKAQPIPETQDGPVQVIVRDNFKDLVIDSDEDVLLEFYAPWCGHCKKLAPDYEKLAGLYTEHDKQVKLAKVDATKNDIPGHQVSSYPTIKFFPAKAKDFPVQYLGNRTIEDLAQFVKDNSRHHADSVLEILKAETGGAAAEYVDKAKEAVKSVVDAVAGMKEEL